MILQAIVIFIVGYIIAGVFYFGLLAMNVLLDDYFKKLRRQNGKGDD